MEIADFTVPDFIMNQYRDIAKQYDPMLEKQGRYIIKKAASIIIPTKEEEQQPSIGVPTWFEQIYQPILNPIMRGAKAQADIIVKPYIIKAVLGLIGVTAISFYLGRKTRKCSA